MFSTRPVAKEQSNEAAARWYLRGVMARGGRNIHDALVEALRTQAAERRFEFGE